MQCIGKFGLSPSCTLKVIAICLIDYYGVGHFHNAAFDALKLIAPGRSEQKDEYVGHFRDHCI